VAKRPLPVNTPLGRSAQRIFSANERMNQMLIENLDPAVWRSKPPGGARTVAAIFTHVHNVRTKWIRLSAPYLEVPCKLDRARSTPEQIRAGLAESAAGCAKMLLEAFGGGGRIEKFHRDQWARPWPAGMEMLCYMVAHEAHHRGQVSIIARQLGFPLRREISAALWNWERMWKEDGASLDPGAGRVGKP
jgi:uncharacterized damage-inducible protein DinB